MNMELSRRQKRRLLWHDFITAWTFLCFRLLLCSLEGSPSVALLSMWKSGCGVCFSGLESWSGDRYFALYVREISFQSGPPRIQCIVVYKSSFPRLVPLP